MATKATHSGSCQLCGQRQLLPGGRLSIHGYNVRWSQFVGTCPGTKHLPFEQDISLIENAISHALATAASIDATAASYRETPAEGAVIAKAYVWVKGEGRLKSRYVWQNVTVQATVRSWSSATEGESPTYTTFAYSDNPLRDGTQLPYAIKTMADAVLHLNRLYAKHLDGEAGRYRQYARWQTERITGWAPSPLTPRPAAV